MPLEGEWAACASDSVKSSCEGTVELDVLIVMLEHANDLSESKGTEGTAKVELAYREDRDVFPNTHGRLPTIGRVTYQWSHVDKYGELVAVSIRLEESGAALHYGDVLEVRDRGWVMSKLLEAERISQMEMQVCRNARIETFKSTMPTKPLVSFSRSIAACQSRTISGGGHIVIREKELCIL